MSEEFELGKAVVAPALALFSAAIGYYAARAGGSDIRVVGPPPSGKTSRVPVLSETYTEEDIRAQVRENILFDDSGSELDIKLQKAREDHSDIIEWIGYRGINRTCGAHVAEIPLNLTLANVGDRPGILGSISATSQIELDKDILLSIHVKGLPITLRESETAILPASLQLNIPWKPDKSYHENLVRCNQLVTCLAKSPIKFIICLEVVALSRRFRAQAKYREVKQTIVLDYTELTQDSCVSSADLKKIINRIDLLDRAERRVASEHFDWSGRLSKKHDDALSMFGDTGSNARKIVEELVKFMRFEGISFWPSEDGFGVYGPSKIDVVNIKKNNSESLYLEVDALRYRELAKLPEFQERLSFDESVEGLSVVEISNDSIELAKDIITYMGLILSHPELRNR